MVRAANSWITHPSPTTTKATMTNLLTPQPGGGKDNRMMMPLSLDSKPKVLLRSSTNGSTQSLNRRISSSDHHDDDKENATSGVNGNEEDLVFLMTSPKDTLSVHNNNNSRPMPFDALPPFGTHKKELVVIVPQQQQQDSTKEDDDDENIFLSPSGPSHLYKRDNSTPKNDPEQVPASTTSASTAVSAITTTTTVTSTSSTGNAVGKGKAFWMNFLDQPQKSLSPGEEEDDEKYTPLGRMIQRTFTTGSPLSDASAYNSPAVVSVSGAAANKKKDSPSELAQLFQKRRSTITTTIEQLQQQVVSPPAVVQTPPPAGTTTKLGASARKSSAVKAFWEKAQASSQTPRQSTGSSVAPVPEHASEFVRTFQKRHSSPEASSNTAATTSPPAAASAAPSGVVQNGSVETESIISPVQAAKLRFEQQSRQSMARQEFVRSASLNLSTVNNNNKTFKSTTMVTEPTTMKKEFISQVREGQSSQKLSTTPLPTSTGAAATSPGSPDDVFEIGGPVQTPTSLSSSSSSNPRSSGIEAPGGGKSEKDYSNRFLGAYPAWHQASLKPQDGTASATNGASNKDSNTAENKLSFGWPRKTPQTAPPKLKALSREQPATKPDDMNHCYPVNEATTNTPSTSKAGEAAVEDFRNVLQAWRTKSDDKPNANFLSPENTHGVPRPSTTGKLPAHSTNSSNNPVTPKAFLMREKKDGISEKIQVFDKDYFDRVREQPPAFDDCPSGDPWSTPMDNKGGSSVRYVDSDVYEENYLECDEPNRALVILENNDTFQIMVGDSRSKGNNVDELKIRNVELVASSNQELNGCVPCECLGSIFSGSDDLISFFLPQLGMACACGKQKPRGFIDPDDPTALENVLRPWQVEFLKSFGIYRGEQLVKARHRSAGILARALREWRRKHGMAPFKTSSCGMAIDIWAKTCKIYVRSIRKQINAGQDLLDRRPDDVMKELIQFVGDLPAAPKRRKELLASFEIEPESQMEV